MIFVLVHNCAMPASTRGGAAGGNREDEASTGGSEEQPAVDVVALMAAISRIEEQVSAVATAAEARSVAAEARFAALEASAGIAGSDEGWEVRVETCRFQGCDKPRFREGERVHDYCGRTHAQAAGALEESDDEAGIDPDRQVAAPHTPTFYDTLAGQDSRLERLVATPEFRQYMDELHRSDMPRAALAEDLLSLYQDLQVTISDTRAARQHAVARALESHARGLARIIDYNVIFPAAYGGPKAHKFVHIARRAFAEEESLANLFLGEGARNLGGERVRKEFDQCCAALKKLPFEGKDRDTSPRGERGDRGGKKKRQQQQQQPSRPQPQQQQQQQQSPRPRQQQQQQQQQRGRSPSRASNRGGGGTQGAAGNAAPRQ